jgi:CRP-like cAMP-binding protein
MLSLLSITEEGRTIEVGMIGNEGMTGVPVILRSGKAPYEVMVQLAGNALRIRGDALREAFNRGGTLQDLLLRYTHSLLIQVAQSAACNRFHTVEERLCRWLLVSRDRVQTDTIQLTQEFISHMLGVPRTSVTMIAGALQKEGLIKYSRGKITLLDRRGLEAASCECYRRVQEGIGQLLIA